MFATKKIPAPVCEKFGNSESFSWVSFRKPRRKCAFFSMVLENALQNGRWCQAKTDLTKDDAKGKQTEMSGNISNEKGFKRKTACCEMMMVDFWGEKVVKRHVTTMPREREESDVKEGCDTESSYLHTRTHTHTHILSYLFNVVESFFLRATKEWACWTAIFCFSCRATCRPQLARLLVYARDQAVGITSRGGWLTCQGVPNSYCSIILSLAHSCRCWARGKIAWAPCS